MSITVTWDNLEKTIVLQHFEGAWTWETFTLSAEETQSMMRSVTHQVHLLSDFTNSGPLPIGGALTQARNVLKRYPENGGLIIIVSPGIFIRSLVNTFRRAFYSSFGKKVFAVETIEQAHAFIRKETQTSLHS